MPQIITKIHAPDFLAADRSTIIFKAFELLKDNESIEITSDHNPTPLFQKFTNEKSNMFTWNYLEKGPEVWRVEIGKK